MILVWVVLMNPVFSQVQPEPFQNIPPKKLHISASCVFGQLVQFDLKDGVVIYHQVDTNKRTRDKSVHPSPEAWAKFVNRLNEAKLYCWSPEYKIMALDGGDWSITIAVGAHEFYSHGDNAYPKDGAEYLTAKEISPSRPFMLIWKAACDLVQEDPGNYPLK